MTRQNYLGKTPGEDHQLQLMYQLGDLDQEPDAILHASFNYNTTRLTLTDLRGNTLLWSTPAKCGYKGTVRRTVFASKACVNQMADEMVELDITRLHLRLKGITRTTRRQLGKLLSAKGLMILSVEDVTPLPFNGTRLRRKRRR